MDATFKQGQEVQALYFNKSGFEGESMISVGSFGVEKITVSMENGQMAGFPWFVVWKDGKPCQKWNGANSALEGVKL